eukprot:CFRG4349T1
MKRSISKVLVLAILLSTISILTLARTLTSSIAVRNLGSHEEMTQYMYRTKDGMEKQDFCPVGQICCPVCGMSVPDVKKSAAVVLNEGQEIHACSDGCAHKLFDDVLSYSLGTDRELLTDANIETHESVNTRVNMDGTQCPVCSMQATKGHYVRMKGNQYVYFCGMDKQVEMFTKDPKKYLDTIRNTKGEDEGDVYCSGRTVMFMYSGFTTSDTTCIVLWFSWFVLDSRIKVCTGVVACFMLAVFHEYMSAYRRKLVYMQRMQGFTPEKRSLLGGHSVEQTSHSTSPDSSQINMTRFAERASAVHVRNRGLDLTVALLYGLSIIMGYLLMLAAMTFHTALFMGVVTGFVCGQYLFRDCDAPVIPGEPVVASTEPCCTA